MQPGTCRRWPLAAAFAPLALVAGAPPLAAQTESAPAQSALAAGQDTVSINALTSSPQPASTDPQAATLAGPPAPAIHWLAEASGGIADRDGGPRGGFAVTGLSRKLGDYYLRGAFTAYRSTLERSDTALPSTYLVGTLGGGGRFGHWVFDGWASYGRQQYGEINGATGPRSSPFHSSPYWALGADFGRILRLGPHWYATPTLTLTYTYSRLLHPGYHNDGTDDFQSSEPALTGIAAIRLDHTLGRAQQSLIGLGYSHHATSNGLSTVTLLGFDTQSGHAVPELGVLHRR
ncbi:MAG TPA: hypothetical protein VFF94_03920, partial [Novosphingobium sp.]|nr:hypothetical protein [Novosphingobium sp.]